MPFATIHACMGPGRGSAPCRPIDCIDVRATSDVMSDDSASSGRRSMIHNAASTSHSAHAGGAVLAPVLSANVLVLNKFYQAIRVINVRRAFSLLCRELAEVVHIETDAAGPEQVAEPRLRRLDGVSAAQGRVRAGRLRLDPHGALPDRRAADHPPARLRQAPAAGREVQPPQHLRPRRQPLPVLRQEDADDRAVARPRRPQEPGRQEHAGRTSSAAA